MTRYQKSSSSWKKLLASSASAGSSKKEKMESCWQLHSNCTTKEGGEGPLTSLSFFAIVDNPFYYSLLLFSILCTYSTLYGEWPSDGRKAISVLRDGSWSILVLGSSRRLVARPALLRFAFINIVRGGALQRGWRTYRRRETVSSLQYNLVHFISILWSFTIEISVGGSFLWWAGAQKVTRGIFRRKKNRFLSKPSTMTIWRFQSCKISTKMIDTSEPSLGFALIINWLKSFLLLPPPYYCVYLGLFVKF